MGDKIQFEEIQVKVDGKTITKFVPVSDELNLLFQEAAKFKTTYDTFAKDHAEELKKAKATADNELYKSFSNINMSGFSKENFALWEQEKAQFTQENLDRLAVDLTTFLVSSSSHFNKFVDEVDWNGKHIFKPSVDFVEQTSELTAEVQGDTKTLFKDFITAQNFEIIASQDDEEGDVFGDEEFEAGGDTETDTDPEDTSDEFDDTEEDTDSEDTSDDWDEFEEETEEAEDATDVDLGQDIQNQDGTDTSEIDTTKTEGTQDILEEDLTDFFDQDVEIAEDTTKGPENTDETLNEPAADTQTETESKKEVQTLDFEFNLLSKKFNLGAIELPQGTDTALAQERIDSIADILGSNGNTETTVTAIKKFNSYAQDASNYLKVTNNDADKVTFATELTNSLTVVENSIAEFKFALKALATNGNDEDLGKARRLAVTKFLDIEVSLLKGQAAFTNLSKKNDGFAAFLGNKQDKLVQKEENGIVNKVIETAERAKDAVTDNVKQTVEAVEKGVNKTLETVGLKDKEKLVDTDVKEVVETPDAEDHYGDDLFGDAEEVIVDRKPTIFDAVESFNTNLQEVEIKGLQKNTKVYALDENSNDNVIVVDLREGTLPKKKSFAKFSGGHDTYVFYVTNQNQLKHNRIYDVDGVSDVFIVTSDKSMKSASAKLGQNFTDVTFNGRTVFQMRNSSSETSTLGRLNVFAVDENFEFVANPETGHALTSSLTLNDDSKTFTSVDVADRRAMHDTMHYLSSLSSDGFGLEFAEEADEADLFPRRNLREEADEEILDVAPQRNEAEQTKTIFDAVEAKLPHHDKVVVGKDGTFAVYADAITEENNIFVVDLTKGAFSKGFYKAVKELSSGNDRYVIFTDNANFGKSSHARINDRLGRNNVEFYTTNPDVKISSTVVTQNFTDVGLSSKGRRGLIQLRHNKTNKPFDYEVSLTLVNKDFSKAETPLSSSFRLSEPNKFAESDIGTGVLFGRVVNRQK